MRLQCSNRTWGRRMACRRLQTLGVDGGCCRLAIHHTSSCLNVVRVLLLMKEEAKEEAICGTLNLNAKEIVQGPEILRGKFFMQLLDDGLQK
jgi:hypothetical protein